MDLLFRISVFFTMFFISCCSADVRFTSRGLQQDSLVEIVENRSDSAYISGECSYYGKKFHGRKTANGEIFDMYGYTAAHRTLPFGTFLEVENLQNGKKVIVRINDRGPFKKKRILDLSYAAARDIDMLKSGVTDIKAKILSRGEE